MTTYVRVDSFDLKATGYYNNTVGVNLFTYNNVYRAVVDRIVKQKIDKKFKEPKPIGDLLESKGLGILNLEKMSTWAEVSYL